jgi:hypothetical protein
MATDRAFAKMDDRGPQIRRELRILGHEGYKADDDLQPVPGRASERARSTGRYGVHQR